MQTITRGELAFDVAIAGAQGAPMVLMLHGFPQTAYTWRHQMQPLADAGFYGVAPNQRGYSAGARPGQVADYQTHLLVQDALGLLEALGYDEAHVVGHDWGGQLSWLLAAYHPEKVSSLTVLSRPHPQAFVTSLARDTAQAERSKHHKAFQSKDAADKLLENDAKRLRSMFSDQGVPTLDQNAYLSILGEFDALDAAINWYRAPVHAGAQQPLGGAEVPDIEVPTLYIWGDADATVGEIAALGTADYVSAHYQFEVLPDVGHFITDQAGPRVTELLLAHLLNSK